MANEKREDKVDGVDVVNQTGDFNRGYRQSDVEQIFRDAKVHSWKDLLSFVEKKGDSEWHITPGEAIAMKQDLQRLVQSNTPFESNPAKAFEVMHGGGGHSSHGRESRGHGSHDESHDHEARGHESHGHSSGEHGSHERSGGEPRRRQR